MLSLRTLVLLGATVYLLPSDPVRQQAFLKTASDTYTYAVTICDREPEFCAKAGTVYEDLKTRAHFGAGVIYTLVTDTVRGNEPVPPDTTQPAHQSPRWDGSSRRSLAASGTLTPRDLAPAWRNDQADHSPRSYR